VKTVVLLRQRREGAVIGRCWAPFMTRMSAAVWSPHSQLTVNLNWRISDGITDTKNRTTVFKDWLYIYCLAQVGWRFADGVGYRCNEPINVSNFPFPISPRGGFLRGNGASLFFTCFDYVVLLLVGSANLGHRCLHCSRPMEFNKRREAVDRLLANKPELDRPSSRLLNNRISPEKPVWETSAYN
jgi:hypothetical protein